MPQTTQAVLRFGDEYQAYLDKEYPLTDRPGFAVSTVRPSQVLQFPGVTYESTMMVRRLMEENDRRFNIFGRPSFAHNHLPHHILTSYSLGASPKHLQATFEANVKAMAPMPAPTIGGDGSDQKGTETKETENSTVGQDARELVINQDNWHDTKLLGVKDHYPAYLIFFHKEIERIGGMETLEKYFFSSAANSGGKQNKKGPRMFTRLFSGAFHPWIHLGFALEFRDQVTLAEAFAQAAIHAGEELGSAFPDNWPTVPSAKSHARRRSSQTIDTDASFIDPRRTQVSASNMTGMMGNLHSNTTPLTFSTSVTTGYRNLAHVSLLEIYAELCESKDIEIPAYDPDMSINDRLAAVVKGDQGEKIRKIADKWGLTEGELVKAGEADGWARRVEELHVLCTLLAVGTGRAGRETRVDFFLMHCLTSSIFLSSVLVHLTPPHRLVILKSYLTVVLVTALSRGRPRIDPEIVLAHTAFPSPRKVAKSNDAPGKDVEGLDEQTETIGKLEDSTYGNFWTGVVDNALHAHDSHIIKSVRSLLLYSRLYGHLPPGGLLGSYKGNSKEETLPGISKLGGDIFARAVSVIFEQTGWAQDRAQGGDEDFWDFSALGYDEAWKEPKEKEDKK